MLWLLMARSSVCILLAAGPALVGAPARADPGADLADSAGDTVDDDTGAPLDVPEGDILRSSIRSTSDGIALNVQVRTPTAPLSDKAWDGATEIAWELDTTGDGEADFDADYYMDEGQITGHVYRHTDNEDEPDLCHLKSATFSPDAGYTAVVDSACIGAPRRVGYAAEFSYDTNPGDDAAPITDDHAPDTGMSPETQQPAPSPAPPPPVQIRASPPAPSPSVSPAEAATMAKIVAAPLSGRSPGTPEAARAPPSTSPSAGDARSLPPTQLARTGPSRPLAALAGAAIALGGLCVMGAADRKLSW